MNAERTLILATQAGHGEYLLNNALALYALSGLSVLIILFSVTIVFYFCVYFLNYIIEKFKKEDENEQ